MRGHKTIWGWMLRLLVACLLMVAAPSGALAAGDVHVDPNSPAGKEYSIPLGNARGTGTGSGGSGGSGGSSGSQLFGVGISNTTPPGSSGGSGHPGGGGGHGTPGSSGSSAGNQSAGSGPSAPVSAAQLEAAKKALGDSGGVPWVVWLLGSALLLLLAVGLGGVAVTKTNRRATAGP
jgi:hypothetical protein